MSVEKTTIGGYALAVGTALGAGAAAIPAGMMDRTRVILLVLAASLGTFGSVLLGTNAREKKQSDQQAGARVEDPNNPGQYVDRGQVAPATPPGVYVSTVGGLRPPGKS